MIFLENCLSFFRSNFLAESLYKWWWAGTIPNSIISRCCGKTTDKIGLPNKWTIYWSDSLMTIHLYCFIFLSVNLRCEIWSIQSCCPIHFISSAKMSANKFRYSSQSFFSKQRFQKLFQLDEAIRKLNPENIMFIIYFIIILKFLLLPVILLSMRHYENNNKFRLYQY